MSVPPRGSDRPTYTRYRARRRLLVLRPRDERPAALDGRPGTPGAVNGRGRAGGPRRPRRPLAGALTAPLPWWRRLTRRRIVAAVALLLVGWLLLSIALFLISSHFERVSPPADVSSALDPAGYPLTSVNNILVLGSDRRQSGSREPGAETTGFGRSDTIMLLRTGGGHSARLSIPRDTIVEIPGHGLQKINAAHAYGGPAESIDVIKHWLGIPINHVVEVNFEDFPQLIDAMGGVDYTGGCIDARLDGGFIRGGYTLKLGAGTHHIGGKEALAIARARENTCAPNETDINREEHQQALFNAMKGRLLSFSSFVRLPLIAWNAPPAIISDMSGPTLLGLFGALAVDGTPPTRVLRPTGTTTLPTGEAGLTVSEGARHAAVEAFLRG